ncbi:unnamed protein product, partial [Durusdinium trenchii]
RRGVRKWLFAHQMDEVFGKEVAEGMRERKRMDPDLWESETRFHPECPQQEEFRQYLCLVEDAHEDEHCEEVDRLYSCLDQDSDSSDAGSTGKKRGKAEAQPKTKAVNEANAKLKWALALLVDNLKNLPMPQHTSDKYAASVKEDCDEKTTIVQESREPENVSVKINGKDGKPVQVNMQMLSPEAIVKHLFSCGLEIDDRLVESYWSHLEDVNDDWAAQTSSFREAVSRPVLPLGCYGDEAQEGLQNAPLLKIFGIFMNLPLYRPKATRLSRYLIFCIESNKLYSVQETLFPVLRRMVESFNMLTQIGIGDRRFLVSEVRGDQVFIRQIFSHKSMWTSHQICFRCAACTGGPLSYTNYDGEWANTLRSTREFVQDELPAEECPLVDLYFFNISVIKNCTLHVINLGLLGVANGSAFGMLLDLQWWGDTSSGYDEPMSKAFDAFTAWRKARKIYTSQPRFRPKALLRENYGFFLNCKGFNARVVCEWLRHTLVDLSASPQRHMDERSDLCLVAMILGCTARVRLGFTMPHFLCAMVADSGSVFLSDIVLLSALPCVIFIGALLWCINQVELEELRLELTTLHQANEIERSGRQFLLAYKKLALLTRKLQLDLKNTLEEERKAKGEKSEAEPKKRATAKAKGKAKAKAKTKASAMEDIAERKAMESLTVAEPKPKAKSKGGRLRKMIRTPTPPSFRERMSESRKRVREASPKPAVSEEDSDIEIELAIEKAAQEINMEVADVKMSDCPTPKRRLFATDDEATAPASNVNAASADGHRPSEAEAPKAKRKPRARKSKDAEPEVDPPAAEAAPKAKAKAARKPRRKAVQIDVANEDLQDDLMRDIIRSNFNKVENLDLDSFKEFCMAMEKEADLKNSKTVPYWTRASSGVKWLAQPGAPQVAYFSVSDSNVTKSVSWNKRMLAMHASAVLFAVWIDQQDLFDIYTESDDNRRFNLEMAKIKFNGQRALEGLNAKAQQMGYQGREYPVMFGLKMVELYDALVGTRTGMPTLPPRLPPLDETLAQALDQDEENDAESSWAEAELTAVVRYLRGGKSLQLPLDVRTVLPTRF